MEIKDLTLAIQNVQEQLNGSQRFIPVKDLERALINALWQVAEWQRDWKRSRKDPVSKWDLLSDADREHYDQEPLANIIGCQTCGWIMTTEGHFARHYVVTDLNYTNLGTCWTKVAPEYVGTRPEWTMDHMPEA